MRTLRRLHMAGIAISGAALAFAVFGLPRLSIALLSLAVFLQFFSLEALRALSTTQPWSKKP